MGMQATQIQSPQTNRPMGKGSFQHSDGLPHGDYGDPNFRGSNVENMPAELAPFGRNIVEVGGMNGRPQQATQGLGKGSSNSSTPFAQGGNVTYPGQGGQPQMGKPNTYSNTVGPWDNASIQPRTQSGKGKGY